jgi:microcystin-dependent protein
MSYPPNFGRTANYTRDQNAGLPAPAPSKLDAEMNALVQTVSQMNTFVRGITTADGRLRGVPQAVAQALVATVSGQVTLHVDYGYTICLVANVPWDSAFSSNSVLVSTGAGLLFPGDFTVETGLTPAVTVIKTPSLADGTEITAYFFTPGTNILTQLAAVTPNYGAALVGINDAGGIIDATTVEEALQEITGRLLGLMADVGNVSELVRSTGAVAMAADLDMGGNKITGLAAATEADEAVNLGQISAFIAQWNQLQQFYLKRDGSAAMSGPLNLGNQRATNAADPDANAPQDLVNVRSLTRLLSASGALPVGISLPYFGSVPPTGWLLCDGSVYKGDTYPVLYSIAPANTKAGPAQGCKIATASLAVSGGAATSATVLDGGMGYESVPTFTVVNTDGGAAPTTQPTIVATVSAVVKDSASGTVASGGVLSITSCTGGSGIRSGAKLVIGGGAALAQMGSGYFRVPDRRGRVSIGSGLESKTPGILDAPDVVKNDAYSATARSAGDVGGAQKVSLIGTELAPHTHSVALDYHAFEGGSTFYGSLTFSPTGDLTASGGGAAHENMPPFIVDTWIIKAQ